MRPYYFVKISQVSFEQSDNQHINATAEPWVECWDTAEPKET